MEISQYQFQDLFASRFRGRAEDGDLLVTLEPTGDLPSFSKEARDFGLEGDIRASGALWTCD